MFSDVFSYSADVVIYSHKEREWKSQCVSARGVAIGG